MNSQLQHIALVANTSWSIYNFRLGLIRALIEKGHHVYAIAPRDDYSDKLTASGVTYIQLQMDAYSTSPLEGLKTMFRLYSIYRKHRFDHIFHYTIKANIYGSIASRIAGCSSISVVTGLGRTFQFSGFAQYFLKTLYRIGIKCTSEIWFLNQEDRQRFIDEGLVKLSKTDLLSSEGVNTSRFVAPPKKTLRKGILRLLFAGRLLKDKGILEFVAAAREITKIHKKIKFEIVGFVNPRNSMSVSLNDLEQWQNEGIINYLGSHEDIRPYIKRADCIVYPSYYQEGISRILLEAASMSRPIITTDQVGCKDVVIDGYNGTIVPKRSVESLVEAIEDFLYLSSEARQQMGANGRSLVKKRYDERIIIDLYFSKMFSPATKNHPTLKSIEHHRIH